MDVLVTGGSGLVGAVIGELTRGHSVTVLTRQPKPASFADDVTVIWDDLRSASDVANVVAKGQFDGVCHLASLADARASVKDPTEYFETNVGGTINLLKALSANRSRRRGRLSLIFASSAGVCGPSSPMRESYTTMPRMPFAASKLTVEQLLGFEAVHGTLGVVSLRWFNVAGGARGLNDQTIQCILPSLIGAATRSLPAAALLIPSSIVGFAHVVDAARAFVMALESTRPSSQEVYNAGSGRGTRVTDAVGLLEELSSRAVHATLPSAADTIKPNARVAGASKVHEWPGWRPLRLITEIVEDVWCFTARQNTERSVSL